LYTIVASFYKKNKSKSDGYILMSNNTGGYVIRYKEDVIRLAEQKQIVNALSAGRGCLRGRYGSDLREINKVGILRAYSLVYMRNRRLEKGDIIYNKTDCNSRLKAI